MEKNNKEQPFSLINIVGTLAENNFSYLMLLLGLSGVSPEVIDEKIINRRKLEKNSELGM